MAYTIVILSLTQVQARQKESSLDRCRAGTGLTQQNNLRLNKFVPRWLLRSNLPIARPQAHILQIGNEIPNFGTVAVSAKEKQL